MLQAQSAVSREGHHISVRGGLPIASEAFPFALASKNFPRSINVMSIAETSNARFLQPFFPPECQHTRVKTREYKYEVDVPARKIHAFAFQPLNLPSDRLSHLERPRHPCLNFRA